MKQIYDICEVIHRYQDDLEWVCGHITAEDDAVESPLYVASVLPSIPKMAQQVVRFCQSLGWQESSWGKGVSSCSSLKT
ncbi:hypothetical protein P3T76_009841 [Phytophthora citrophthora]|uniref:Uncharacterized protein n=1 Tax=Phytophthora citrophthora TaxID=4793 RepID=A0AAD9GEU8_9STRA|nr:hypothetical protein P3T76_009841 [Phytophthora citrophthora]